MRPAALFLDCYGTLLDGDRPVIQEIVADVARRTGLDPVAVDRPWWERFSALCADAVGNAFVTQTELELQSLGEVVAELGAPLSRTELQDVMQPLLSYWRTAAPYADAVELLRTWTTCPVWLVSNIDRADIELAVRSLPPVAGIVTSEDARAYKPDPAVFRLALQQAGVEPSRVVHVGDSYGSDVVGAEAAGVTAIHLVREGQPQGEGVRIGSLTELPAAIERLPDVTVSAVVVRNRSGQVLTVRKRGTTRFMLPGGKLEPGETPVQAAARELGEEVGIHVRADQLAPLGSWTGPAANETGHTILAHVFEAKGAHEEAVPLAELDAVRWLDPADPGGDDLAPLLTRHVLGLVNGRR